MVAYAFPADAHDDLASGIRTFTLQAPRSDRARHARVGEALQLRAGRQGSGDVIEAECIARATLHLAKDGVRRVLDDQTSPDAGQTILNRARNAENARPNAERDRDQLAIGLGFTSYADLWDDVSRSGKGELKRTGVFVRELVGWKVAA